MTEFRNSRVNIALYLTSYLLHFIIPLTFLELPNVQVWRCARNSLHFLVFLGPTRSLHTRDSPTSDVPVSRTRSRNSPAVNKDRTARQRVNNTRAADVGDFKTRSARGSGVRQLVWSTRDQVYVIKSELQGIRCTSVSLNYKGSGVRHVIWISKGQVYVM